MSRPAPLRFGSTNPDLLVGLAEARGVVVDDAPPALSVLLEDLLAERLGADFPPEETRRAIRDLLRHGGFKPTGRNKPASEYLARAAADGRFPRINNVVDACNYVSLCSGFPISLIDLDRAAEGGAALEVREAAEGESFVFNPSGQSIDVAGLVGVACIDGAPIANPVKDSMATKTHSGTRNVLAVVYASRRLADAEAVGALARQMADLLLAHGGAASADAYVLDASGTSPA